MAARCDSQVNHNRNQDDPKLELDIVDNNDGLVQDDFVGPKGSECARFISFKNQEFASLKHLGMKVPDHFESEEEQIQHYLSCEGTKDYRDEDGCTLLHGIGESTPLPIIKLLAEAGVPTDTKNNDGYTPLAVAVGNRNVAAVEYLISLNTDVNVKLQDRYAGNLPQLACYNHSLEILKLLVEAKANISTSNDGFGESLLLIALRRGSFGDLSVDLIRYLVDELHFDVNASDGRSRYPIIEATAFNTSRMSRETEILKFLISRKADLDVADEEGRRAVHIAAIGLCSHALETLVEAGADINVEDHYGRRPIHFAAGHSPDCLEYILDHEVDINVPDKDGWTPLMWAARSGKEWSVRKLTRVGADIWCRGRGYGTEWSALKLARFWNWREAPDVPALLVPRKLTRKAADGRTEVWENDFHRSLPSHRKFSNCMSCDMEIIGLEWKCIECHDKRVQFCFKCYSHVSTLHDPEHTFKNIGPLYDNRPMPPEDDPKDEDEFSEDESVQSIEEVPEIDDDSIVEVEDYDDCDVSVFDNESIDNDAEWMMLYHERTIKI